jgi:hypothetical protein
MANYTVENVEQFPNTTVIKAYPRTAFHLAQTGVPTGTSVAEATMTSGKAELTGLTAGQEYTAYAEVESKDRYLAFQAPAVRIAPSTGIPEAQGQKLLGWTFDPIMASGTKTIATSGVLNFARVPIKEECKVSNILMLMTTKGVTLTAGQCFAGLFQEGTRKLLATTANQATAWVASAPAEVKMALTTTPNIGPGYVTVGFYFVGTTGPTFACAPTTVEAAPNLGVETTGSRFGTGDTGLTTALPASITASEVAAANPWFVALV